MPRWLRGALIGLVLLAAAAVGRAAPPTLTYLFPAGAAQGKTVEVTAGGTFARWPVQAWTDRTDVSIKPAREKGKLTFTVAAGAVPGVCWVRLHDEQGASELRPFVIGTLPEVVEAEPNDEPAKAQRLEAQPVIVNGRLGKAGDVDCFAVRLKKGETLVASLEAYRTLASPMDAVLQVLSADGFVLEENNDDHGLDPQVVFTVPRDDTYLVRTFAFPATPDASVRLAGGDTYIYRLTLTTQGFGDHAFPLALARGETVAVEVSGWNIPADASKRNVKAEAVGSLTLRHPRLANTLPLLVEPHPCIARTKPGERGKPQSITLPVTISGRIQAPGAIDVYEFAAKKGQRLSLRIDAGSIGSQLDPLVRLTDASGKRLAQASDAAGGKAGTRDAALTFALPKEGTYRLEVRDQNQQGSRRHFYRLRVVGPERDYALTVAADRFTMSAGKPLDIPVTVTRGDGFSDDIDITAEGLPPGLTVKPVRSTKAASKSATLRLESKGGPLSSSFRIVGRVAGHDELKRTATAPRIKLPDTTPHLWLTAPK